MALVRSTLNPNAPLFIPAAVREVEDFSPEWWQLVTNSTWYHNYWLSLNPDGFDDHADKNLHGDDAVNLLPDNFDIDASEDNSTMEAQYEEFLQLSENGEGMVSPSASNGIIGAVQQIGESKQSIVKSLNVDGRGRRAVDPAKYAEKPARNVNSKYSPRCIQQPRGTIIKFQISDKIARRASSQRDPASVSLEAHQSHGKSYSLIRSRVTDRVHGRLIRKSSRKSSSTGGLLELRSLRVLPIVTEEKGSSERTLRSLLSKGK